MAETGWTRPKQSFKLKKNNSISGKPPPLRREISVPAGARLNVSLPAGQAKRRNPFSLSSDESVEKRRKLENTLISRDPGNSVDSKDSGLGSADGFPSVFGTNFNPSPSKPEPRLTGTDESKYKPISELSVDWSIKTRVTFTAHQSWLWGEHLSTVESASSVTGGVRCLDIANGNHCLDTSASTQFHSATGYWQHPALAGLNLYPRFGQSSMSKVDRLNLSQDMHRHIVSDWITSLQSVYQLVKAQQCPYFYVCAPSFTCLFRAAGIGGSQQILALLTPTTSGLRSALKREDVDFSSPLQQPLQDIQDNKESCEKGEEGEEGEEPTEFLESLGIQADSLQGFISSHPKNRLQLGISSDGRPDSLVCVEGVECQSLLNYLLNAKLTQGPTGLPPTILSPVAFPGATLKSLKVKEHTLGGKAGQPKSHQIDVQGPILPETLQRLILLSEAHAPSCRVRVHTQEDTISFTLFNSPEDQVAPSAFASAGLKDSGLQESLLNKFCQVQTGGPDKIIRELNIRKGFFESTEISLNGNR